MQAVPDHFDHPDDRAEFRHAAHRPGLELYRARIVRHAFEAHTHEAYGIGLIEAGAERFRYRGQEHLAGRGAVVLMNPDELHTGRAAGREGWLYRMVYLDPSLMEALTGGPAWSFDQTVVDDPALAGRLAPLLARLWQADAALDLDGLLLQLCEALAPRARGTPTWATTGPAPRFAPVLDFLRAEMHRRLTLDELAAVAGLSPFHFLRSFRAAHHVTPQQMLMALRLFEAKQRLARGAAPADVAAAVGLSDQAHLTRAFARRYGVTPARYQQQVGTRPRRVAPATLHGP